VLGGLLLVGVLFSGSTYVQAAEDSGKATDLKGQSGSGATLDIVGFIDDQIRKGWASTGVKPSGKATDAEWCRRAHLDLVGRTPTPKELARFLGEPANKRRANLIDRLLGESPKSGEENDRYLDEYANNWATIYTNLLIGRPMNVNNNNNPTSRRGMEHFLRNNFLRNTAYDAMVKEIVGATGRTQTNDNDPDDAPVYNGAVNFYVNRLAEQAAEATSRTARYFLGMQVQCTQCHNHPFNDWKQDQFWSFNAFFRQTALRREGRGRDLQYAELYNRDYKGDGGGNPKKAELFYELRNGTSAVAYPKFVDGTEINPSGYVAEVDRRKELAQLIVKSEYFGMAIANRMWSHFLGYGFTKPVDDMGPHNPASHPELIERLGKEFVAEGHNMKKLMRWIMLSEAYSLSSKTTPNNKKDDPSMGVKPAFSHFYMRMMEAEQLYDSIEAVRTMGELVTVDQADYTRKRNQILGQFTLAFGTDDGDEATTFNGTIPQALMMMNGVLTKDCIALGDKADIIPKLMSNGKLKGNEIVEYLFLATVQRKPSAAELGNLAQSLRTGTAETVYQDVLWALLNSNEFLFVY